jgi:apolipoprotein N-acyltransferase
MGAVPDGSPQPATRARLRAGGLAVLAGLAVAASVPPWGWWPLAFVGVALWDRALAGAPWRARAARSWLVGAAWLFPSMLWMWDMTVPGYVIAAGAYATYFAVAGALVPPSAPARWIALPGAVVVGEIARWTFPFGGVPLATLAMGQADAPLARTARLGTAILVSGLVAVVGVALAAACDRRWRAALTGAGIVTLLLVAAVVAPRARDVGPLSFALVQGGGPQRTRAATTDEREVFERHLAASGRIGTPVDLVLWPENVVSVEGPVAHTREGRELADLADRLDATLVVGVTEGVDRDRFLNAAVVYGPDGAQGARYDKVRRVPFGEYVPLRGLVERLAGEDSGLPGRDAVAGTGPAVLDTAVGRLATVVSWEVFFTNRAREGVLEGGEVLVNPTNGSSYWLTQVQTQQVASSRLRAIESDRWVLQASPTGFTAVVTPDGSVVARTGVSEQAVVEGVARRRAGDTIATVLGPGPVVALAVVAIAAAWWLERRRSPAGPSDDADHRRPIDAAVT